MRSFTKAQVVKCYTVEIAEPRLIDFTAADFEALMPHLSIVTLESKGESSKAQHDPELLAENMKSEDVFEARAKAEQESLTIIAQAENQAAGILQKAQNQAEDLIRQATADVEKMCLDALQNKDIVYTEAKSEGFREGMEAGQAQIIALTEKAERYVELAKRAFQLEYEKVDENLLHLSIRIAEKVIRSTLTLEPERILQIIQSMTLLPQEREGWLLHLSPNDVITLKEFSLERPPAIPFIADSSLSQGDCFLECQEGLFDARLQGQLDKLEQGLREELTRKKGQVNGEMASTG